MKKLFFVFVVFLMASAIVFIGGCQKEEGMAGQAGAAASYPNVWGGCKKSQLDMVKCPNGIKYQCKKTLTGNKWKKVVPIVSCEIAGKSGGIGGPALTCTEDKNCDTDGDGVFNDCCDTGTVNGIPS
ncbi:MAG: hypothetical protein N3D84_02650 [Candidatus Woesearchaeota archaeon]|nr:hypothetical protein [Candidatus Woesearchaeota archaeon]